jgi:signal transduction histidine kinase/ligand-binding sensor domain-containing protein
MAVLAAGRFKGPCFGRLFLGEGLVFPRSSLQPLDMSIPRHGQNRIAHFLGAQGWLAGVMLFWLCARVAFSAPVAQDDYLIDTWTGDEGLPNSSVSAIAQTPEGYLWIGTLNGLARFDGVRFVNYDPINTPQLRHARVRRLFVDGNGTLWINTYDNSLTSWRKGVFTHEHIAQEIAKVFTRSNEVVLTMLNGDLLTRKGPPDRPGEWSSFRPVERVTGKYYHEDGAGLFWYYTRDGAVGRITGTNSAIVPAHLGLEGLRVRSMAVDRVGRVWIGSDKGVAVWDGARFQDQTPTNGEPALDVSFMTCLADGSCWVFGNGKVRRMIDRRWVAEAKEWEAISASSDFDLEPYEDGNGGVWFRHFGQGLFHARQDGKLERLTSRNGLPGDRVQGCFQDREGSLWAGIDRGGLVRLRERRFQVTVFGEDSATQATATVCEDKHGVLWAGTYGAGLNRLENGQKTAFLTPERSRQGFVFSAVPDPTGKRIWLSAGREDLYYCEDGKVLPSTNELHGIKSLCMDQEGQLWIGLARGLARLSNGIVHRFGPVDGFDITDVHALAEGRNGDMWIGGGNGKLYHFRDGKFTAYGANDKLAGQTIWSLLPDADGTVWVGTFRGGLLRFKDETFTRFTTADGLPSDVICQILDDGDGKLWIGSHKGIFQVAKAALNMERSSSPFSLPCTSYGYYDGLPTLECSGGYQPSAWRRADGTLLFSTLKGIVSIRPGDIPASRPPPPVVIEAMSVDGKTVFGEDLLNRGNADSTNSARVVTKAGGELQIPPGKHFFEFHYTGLSFAAPDKVRFRYQLEGLGDEWVETGPRREVHFSPLGPGQYVFRVTACNNEGVWNEQDARLAFTVLPFFYETRWFQALVVCLAVIAVAGVVRFLVVRRMRRKLELLERQRAVERDRARIAQDIHDDLGAGLTRIMLQSELAQKKTAPEMQEHLGRIGDVARKMTRTMDEIVWAVDPQHDSLSGLVEYAMAYADEFLQVAGIRCRMDLPAELPPLHVDAELRYNLFLALKEALNNAVKHSHATEVWLRLRLEPAGFTVIVEDNGRGLGSENGNGDGGEHRIVSGHGLANLEERLNKVGGRCEIFTTRGKGVRVEMTVGTNSKGSPEMAMSRHGRSN